MATIPVTGHLDLNLNQLVNVLLHPLAVDPASPTDNQVWFNTAEGRIKLRAGGITKPLALLDDVTAGSITGALWDAQSVVVAVLDDTPVVSVVPEGGFLGRPTGGNVGGITGAQAKTILGIPSGSVANEAFVTAAIDALKGAVPTEFDTLIELLTEIQTNGSAIGTINTALALRTEKYSELIGNGALTTFTVTHSLAALDVVLSCVPVAGGAAVLVEWEPISTSAVTLNFNVAPTTDQYRVTVIG